MQILDSSGIVVKSNGVIYTRGMNKHLNDSYTLRLPAELKAKVADSAKLQNRSLNADIVARLEKSFDPVVSSLGIGELMSLLFEKLPTGMQVKIGRIDENETDD